MKTWISAVWEVQLLDTAFVHGPAELLLTNGTAEIKIYLPKRKQVFACIKVFMKRYFDIVEYKPGEKYICPPIF